MRCCCPSIACKVASPNARSTLSGVAATTARDSTGNPHCCSATTIITSVASAIDTASVRASGEHDVTVEVRGARRAHPGFLFELEVRAP